MLIPERRDRCVYVSSFLHEICVIVSLTFIFFLWFYHRKSSKTEQGRANTKPGGAGLLCNPMTCILWSFAIMKRSFLRALKAYYVFLGAGNWGFADCVLGKSLSWAKNPAPAPTAPPSTTTTTTTPPIVAIMELELILDTLIPPRAPSLRKTTHNAKPQPDVVRTPVATLVDPS